MNWPDEERAETLSAEGSALLGQWMRLDQLPAGAARPETARPETEAERQLAAIWSAVLRCDEVLVSDSFLDLGGNSITSLQVVAKAVAIGIQVTARQVIEAADLGELASIATAVDEQAVEAGPDLAVGPVALTPIQRWFFSQEFDEPHRWDQAVVLELVTRLDPDLLDAAVQAVVAHHDVLRSRFIREDDGWAQVVDPGGLAAVQVLPVGGGAGDHVDEAIALAGQSIDLTSGPLAVAVLLDCDDVRACRLVLAVHHLVVDGVSMRILIEDLDTAYQALRDGAAASLPRRTSSFRSWSRELERFAESDELAEQLPYWAADRVKDDPLGGCEPSPEANLRRDREVLSVELDASVSARVLRDLPRHGAFSVECLLVTGLAIAWQRERGATSLTLDLEGHGRESISSAVEVSRTVGWFTSIYPVRLPVPDHQDLAETLAGVAGTLDEVPGRGLGYGVLRYLSSRGAELSRQGSPSISFNYLGSFAGPAGDSRVLGAPAQLPVVITSERAHRPYVLEVAAADLDGRLLLQWEYAPGVLRSGEASALFERQVAAIGELVEAALALPVGSRRENEFELARVSAAELTAIRDHLAGGRRQ